MDPNQNPDQLTYEQALQLLQGAVQGGAAQGAPAGAGDIAGAVQDRGNYLDPSLGRNEPPGTPMPPAPPAPPTKPPTKPPTPPNGKPDFSDVRKILLGRGQTVFGPGQLPALDELIRLESQYNPNAQNPHSTAYGLFQFLDSTWPAYGGSKTTDPGKQMDIGFKYIKQRYGTPEAALKFWHQHGWY